MRWCACAASRLPCAAGGWPVGLPRATAWCSNACRRARSVDFTCRSVVVGLAGPANVAGAPLGAEPVGMFERKTQSPLVWCATSCTPRRYELRAAPESDALRAASRRFVLRKTVPAPFTPQWRASPMSTYARNVHVAGAGVAGTAGASQRTRPRSWGGLARGRAPRPRAARRAARALSVPARAATSVAAAAQSSRQVSAARGAAAARGACLPAGWLSASWAALGWGRVHAACGEGSSARPGPLQRRRGGAGFVQVSHRRLRAWGCWWLLRRRCCCLHLSGAQTSSSRRSGKASAPLLWVSAGLAPQGSCSARRLSRCPSSAARTDGRASSLVRRRARRRWRQSR